MRPCSIACKSGTKGALSKSESVAQGLKHPREISHRFHKVDFERTLKLCPFKAATLFRDSLRTANQRIRCAVRLRIARRRGGRSHIDRGRWGIWPTPPSTVACPVLLAPLVPTKTVQRGRQTGIPRSGKLRRNRCVTLRPVRKLDRHDYVSQQGIRSNDRASCHSPD
jgi:hypothetical protein